MSFSDNMFLKHKHRRLADINLQLAAPRHDKSYGKMKKKIPITYKRIFVPRLYGAFFHSTFYSSSFFIRYFTVCNQIQCTAVQLRNYVFEKLNAQTSFNKNSLNVFPVSYGGTEIKNQKNIEVFFAD